MLYFKNENVCRMFTFLQDNCIKINISFNMFNLFIFLINIFLDWYHQFLNIIKIHMLIAHYIIFSLYFTSFSSVSHVINIMSRYHKLWRKNQIHYYHIFDILLLYDFLCIIWTDIWTKKYSTIKMNRNNNKIIFLALW